MSTLNATNLKHASSGTNNIVLATDGSSAITTLSSTTIKHASSGTNNIVLDSSARTLMGGVTANANGGVLQLSSGITFPATAVAASNANTLDDYEEGTWTPALTGLTSLTYTQQYGYYIKIGRQVTAYVRILISTGTGSGASVTITGLPFVATTVSEGGNGIGGITYKQITADVLSAIVIDNASQIDFYLAATTGPTALTLSGSKAGAYLIMGSTYVTN